MKLLGIDLETSDISKDAEITEIGAMLMDNATPIMSFSALIQITGDIVPDAVEITGITPGLCAAEGMELSKAMRTLGHLWKQADYIVTHNGLSFDVPLLRRIGGEHSIELEDKPVIDTILDIQYPPKIRSRALDCLAAQHGVLNPYPHRALFDVATMFRILGMYDLKEITRVADTPVTVIRAKVQYETRDLAKAAGYTWTPEIKSWLKRIRRYYMPLEEVREFGIADMGPEYLRYFDM